jgi:glycosyltransferase involved in cell wall biosynthesis
MSFRVLKKIYENLGLKLFEEYKTNYGMPDIIHAHNFCYAGFIASRIKENYTIPIVLTEHSSFIARVKGKLPSDNSVSSLGRKFEALTAVSSTFIRLLSQKFGLQNIGLLPNIVDDYYFSLSHTKKNKCSDAFTFLNIGSIDSNKNHELLIRSFAGQFRSSNVKLKIGGVGPLLNYLKDLTKRLNIKNQVFFLGMLSQSEVREEMTNADCFVLSSKYETFGVVLIEALACGTPVIATRCGGPEDIVNDSNGILVDVDNIEQMQDAMSYMFVHANDFNTEHFRNEVQFKFGSAAFVTNALALYKNAILCHSKG